jgi:hypothetical protein
MKSSTESKGIMPDGRGQTRPISGLIPRFGGDGARNFRLVQVAVAPGI